MGMIVQDTQYKYMASMTLGCRFRGRKAVETLKDAKSLSKGR